MSYERLTIVVSKSEMEALRSISQKEMRRPRDQARLLLRTALEAAIDQTRARNESGADVVQTPAHAL